MASHGKNYPNRALDPRRQPRIGLVGKTSQQLREEHAQTQPPSSQAPASNWSPQGRLVDPKWRSKSMMPERLPDRI